MKNIRKALSGHQDIQNTKLIEQNNEASPNSVFMKQNTINSQNKTELNPKIYCLYHKDQIINSICLDNHCSEKALCYFCELHSPQGEHHVIPIGEFCQKLVQYQNMEQNDTDLFNESLAQIIEGRNANQKLQYFSKKAKESQEYFKDQHLNEIEKMMNKFISDINKMVTDSKSQIIEIYQKQSKGLFSTESLHDKIFKDRACNLILSSMKRQDYNVINQDLRKLHQGQFELAFSKEQIIKIFSQMTEKIQQFIQKTDQMINQELKDFSHYFKKFEKQKNLAKTALFKRAEYRNNQKLKLDKMKLNLMQIQTFEDINNNFQDQIKYMNNKQKAGNILQNSVKNFINQSKTDRQEKGLVKSQLLKQITQNQYKTNPSNHKFIQGLTKKMDSSYTNLSSEYRNNTSVNESSILQKEGNNFTFTSTPISKYYYSHQNDTILSSFRSNDTQKQYQSQALNINTVTTVNQQQIQQEKMDHSKQKQITETLIQSLTFNEDIIVDVQKLNKYILLIAHKSGKISLFEKPNDYNEYQFYNPSIHGSQQDSNKQQNASSYLQSQKSKNGIGIQIIKAEESVTGHQLKQIFQVQAHFVMGIARSFMENQLLFTAGGNKQLNVSLKLWSLYEGSNITEHIEILEMHDRPIKDLRVLKEDQYTKENTKIVVNYVEFVTMGEENVIKVWGLDYESSNFQKNSMQKLSQIQIGTQNIEKIILCKDGFLLHNKQFMVKMYLDPQSKQVSIFQTIKLQISDKIAGVHICDEEKIQMVSESGFIYSYNHQLEKIGKSNDFFKKQLGNRPKHVFIGNQMSFRVLNIFDFCQKGQYLIYVDQSDKISVYAYDFSQDLVIKEQFCYYPQLKSFTFFEDNKYVTQEGSSQIRFWQPFN